LAIVGGGGPVNLVLLGVARTISSSSRFSYSQEISMLVNKSAGREWKATDYPGIERSLFRNNENGGRSSVVRLTQGSRFPRHAHEGTEEVVVLAGMVRIGGVELSAGDYLFTSPGEQHDVVALSDASIFVSSQKATPVVE
jgi:quercetin dioxygenase-like cupin family protein